VALTKRCLFDLEGFQEIGFVRGLPPLQEVQRGLSGAEGDRNPLTRVGDDFDGLAPGSPVVVEGIVAADNPVLVEGFVVACRETSDSDDGWQVVERRNAPLRLELPAAVVVVDLHSPCPRGDHGEVFSGRDGRWVGLVAGDRLTIVGTISSVDPLRLKNERHFTGSIEEYGNMLHNVFFALPFVFGFPFLLGAVAVWKARVETDIPAVSLLCDGSGLICEYPKVPCIVRPTAVGRLHSVARGHVSGAGPPRSDDTPSKVDIDPPGLVLSGAADRSAEDEVP